MWIKKADWVQMLTNSNEFRVRAEFLQQTTNTQREGLKKYMAAFRVEREKSEKASARVCELENKILELNDALNNARKAAVPLASLNLAEMFEDEDPVKVNELRSRIKAEGADIVLAEAVER